MLKHLLFLSLATLLLASCKKDKAEPVSEGYYFVTAKINGVPTEFKTVVGANRFDEDRSPYLLFVTGRGGELHTRQAVPSLTLILNDDAPLTHKTYVSGVDPINAGYSITEMAPYNADPGFVVTITQLTTKEIRGTFSGKLRDNAGDVIDLSEGMFFSRIY